MTLLSTDVYILSELLNSTLFWEFLLFIVQVEYSKQLIYNKQDDFHFQDGFIYVEPKP